MSGTLKPENLGLYLLTSVCLTLEDGQTVFGQLSDLLTEPDALLVDDTAYPLQQVRDLELVSTISDYRAFHGGGTVSGNGGSYAFSREDLAPSFPLQALLYGEFACRVACHLCFSGNAIRAADVRLLSCVHHLNEDQLSKGNYLYYFRDGSYQIGRLIRQTPAPLLQTAQGDTFEFQAEDVTDITKAPEINDTVYVFRKNGAVASGIVSAAQKGRFVLVDRAAQSSFIVRYDDIQELRFQGLLRDDPLAVSMGQDGRKRVIAGLDSGRFFLCKRPFCRDESQWPQMAENMTVTFVAGVSQKGLVAKDVSLGPAAPAPRQTVSLQLQEPPAAERPGEPEAPESSEKSAALPQEPESPPYQGCGVILSRTQDSQTKEYFVNIGDTYIARTYAQYVRCHLPTGRVRFPVDKLEFPIPPGSRNLIRIVSYTCPGDPRLRPQTALSVSLIKVLPYEDVAKVEVLPDGTFRTLSTQIAYLPLLQNQDVELTCSNGSVFTGVLRSCGEEELLCQTEGEEVSIPLEELESVRTYGVLSAYHSSFGTGTIGKFWFHVNNLRRPEDAALAEEGRWGSFTIGQTFKGNGYQASDILLYDDPEQTGVLTGQDGSTGLLVPQDGGEPLHCLLTRPSLRLLRGLELDRLDYPVGYQLRQIGPRTYVNICWVDSINVRKKIREGYLLKYITKSSGAGFGFITPPEQLEEQLRSGQPTGEIYFSASDLLDSPRINTRESYYRVSYAAGSGKTAQEVRILETFPLPSREDAVEETPVPPASAGTAETAPPPSAEESAETPPDTPSIPEAQLYPGMGNTALPLAEFSSRVDGLYPEAGYQFGILMIFTANFARITSQFINGKYKSVPPFDPESVYGFFPEQATLLSDGKPRCATRAYLIRFVPGEPFTGLNGEMHNGIDIRYPVEILQGYVKKQLASLRIEGDQLLIEPAPQIVHVPAPAAPAPAKTAKKQEKTVPPPVRGESVLFEMADQTFALHTFQGETEDGYQVKDGLIPRDSVLQVYRFGVITAFSPTAEVGTLNNLISFSPAVAEPKVLNVLKSQPNAAHFHVLFAHEANQVTEVRCLSKAHLAALKWSEGQVTACETAGRRVRISGGAFHYLSVLSDDLVNRAFRENHLNGQPVLVRQVTHLFQKNLGSPCALAESAVDIRCKKETVTVQYDEGRDIFLGFRNPSYSYPLYGTFARLKPLVGTQALVEFWISRDLLNLEAHLNGDTGEEDAAAGGGESLDDTSLDSVSREPLVQLCLRQADLRQMNLKNISLNENGIPADQDQAQRAVSFLLGRPSDQEILAAAKVLLAYPELEASNVTGSRRRRPAWIGGILLTALQKRCRRAGLDANCVFGEHTYYLSLLLRYSVKPRQKGAADLDFLYSLLLQDFGTREELSAYTRSSPNNVTEQAVSSLLSRPCRQSSECFARLMPLDKQSVERLCRFLEKEPALTGQLQQYAAQVDSTIRADGSSLDLLQALRERYIRDKNRFANLFRELDQQNRIASDVQEILFKMQGRFLKLVCREDAERFDRLLNICRQISDYTSRGGFADQEQTLRTAYRELCELEAEILTHPCRESVEILVMNDAFTPENSVLSRLRRETAALLNQLYRSPEIAPRITCVPNEAEIVKGQETLLLVVQNGTETMNLQPADNARLFLESYTEGVTVSGEIPLRQLHLAAGQQEAVEAVLVVDNWVPRTVNLGWSVEFECSDGFEDNGSVHKVRRSQDQNEPLVLQIGQSGDRKKDLNAANPYQEPARGQPLESSDMFFGRTEEHQAVWESIIRRGPDGNEFIPGSAVILHGQKKSGKTSLVNQIKNAIKSDPALRQQAIILDFHNILDDVGGVRTIQNFRFKDAFYLSILTRFEDEIYDNHPEVADMLEEHHIEIPDLEWRDGTAAVPFDQFFRKFFRADNGQHTVVLFMDEFTLLCTSILEEIRRNPQNTGLSAVPNFIKTFSQYGFVQVVIGHVAMMRAFDELGVLNHTSEFAKTVEIAALDEPASRQLITLPMRRAFGFDVYNTALGRQAVERLLDLSGCNPTYLMRLCNQMFLYYTDPARCPRSQLVVSDVDAMLRSFIPDLRLSDFDILLSEDGDEVQEPETRETYLYLKCAASLSARQYDRRTADSRQVAQELRQILGFDEETVERTQNLLEARHVISITYGGRIKINAGLFSEFITKRNGGW